MAEGSVPRSCRQTGPECVHHAVNRGNRKTAIFHKPGDYKAFLRVLAQAKTRFEMRILAFCLMRNHWHLVLWPDRQEAISAFMHWLTSTHVRRYHLHYDLVGTGWTSWIAMMIFLVELGLGLAYAWKKGALEWE